MASLITKLAKGTVADRNNEFMVQSSSHNHSHHHSHINNSKAIGLQSGIHASAIGKPTALRSLDRDFKGIRTLKEVDIRVEDMDIREEERRSVSGQSDSGVDEGFDGRKGVSGERKMESDDELPLHHPGMPSKGNEGW